MICSLLQSSLLPSRAVCMSMMLCGVERDGGWDEVFGA